MYITFSDLLYVPIMFVIVLGIACCGPYLVGKLLHVSVPTPREALRQFLGKK